MAGSLSADTLGFILVCVVIAVIVFSALADSLGLGKSKPDFAKFV